MSQKAGDMTPEYVILCWVRVIESINDNSGVKEVYRRLRVVPQFTSGQSNPLIMGDICRLVWGLSLPLPTESESSILKLR